MGVSGFSLQWPSEAGKISTAYSAGTGFIMIAAPTGAIIKSGSAGLVVAAVADTVQVSTGLYTVIYSNLRNLRVQTGQQVNAGDPIGESAGPDAIRLMLLQVIDPTPTLPSQPAPTAQTPATPQTQTPAPAAQPATTTPASTTSEKKLYVSPNKDAVRMRSQAVINDTNVIGQVNGSDVLEVIEPTNAARAKIGVEGQWVNIRTLWGLSGFTAAQFLKEYSGAIPTISPTPYGAANVTGMNLDMHHPLGHPSPDRMKGIGWIRVKFNVSYNPDEPNEQKRYGNTDINGTFNKVKPFLEPYVRAGIKVLMVFTHQLYGEGAGYNWDTIDAGGWARLIPTYADYAKRTAQLFANTGLVHAYQIWNEQDTPKGKGRAAVPISSTDYANMLTQTIRAIRTVDAKTAIITGGHVTGAGTGSQYARETLAAMPSDVRPDGIAFHPYGLGPAGNKFSNNGSLADALRIFGTLLPGKPMWISEWGVLGLQGNMDVVGDITGYASSFVNIIKGQYSGQVAAACWYAWADGMDDGYGLVDKNDQPKTPLSQRFLAM